MQLPMRPEEGDGTLGVGIKKGCERPTMGAGNPTQVPWKNINSSSFPSHLSSPWFMLLGGHFGMLCVCQRMRKKL